jgi:hypothetical protein
MPDIICPKAKLDFSCKKCGKKTTFSARKMAKNVYFERCSALIFQRIFAMNSNIVENLGNFIYFSNVQ